MIVGFILMNRASFSQTVSPPKITTMARVTSCITDRVRVFAHSTALASRVSGTKTSVATISPG